MTLSRKIKKGDKLLIHAVAIANEIHETVDVRIIGSDRDEGDMYEVCIYTDGVAENTSPHLEVGWRVKLYSNEGDILFLWEDRALVKWDDMAVPQMPLIENLKVI